MENTTHKIFVPIHLLEIKTKIDKMPETDGQKAMFVDVVDNGSGTGLESASMVFYRISQILHEMSRNAIVEQAKDDVNNRLDLSNIISSAAEQAKNDDK